MELDDGTLRDEGLAPPSGARGSVLIIACGALAREILALKGLNEWTHLDLRCLPANLHLRPDRIPDDGSRRPSREARGPLHPVFVAYADCGTGGLLAARCRALEVEMIAGPHCYRFFDGNETFAARDDSEMTASS